jgi:hypothetical protein
MNILYIFINQLAGRVAETLKRLVTGWKVRGTNPSEGEIFRTCPDRLWGPPSLLYNAYWVSTGVESGRSVTLTPHPFYCPGLKKQSRAVTLISLRVFVACKKGETLLLTSLTQHIKNCQLHNKATCFG